MINKKVFNSADLDANYILAYIHNLNTTDIIVKYYDNNRVEQPTSSSLRLITANEITLDLGGEITGDHTLIIFYEGTVTASGKKAFGLTNQNTEPVGSSRIILGEANTPAFNITWTNLKAWVLNSFSGTFMDTVCSNVLNKNTARANLGVYSINQVDTAVNAKASLYPSAYGAALGVSNTLKYNPSEPYHPATLRNANNIGFKLLFSVKTLAAGTFDQIYFRNTDKITSEPTIAVMGGGWYRITHNLGLPNYHVFGSACSLTAFGYVSIRIYANYFDVITSDDSSSRAIDFNIYMFEIPATYVAN